MNIPLSTSYVVHGVVELQQESSAKLTNQRVSDAFTSSPFSIHVCHILPTSKFQHSYFTYFYISEQHVWKLWVWIQFTGLTLPLWGTPVNNPITLISPVPWVGSIFCRWQSMRSSANFRTFFSESQNANPLDAELGPDFNAKWPFKVIQGHLFRCQWRATKGLHSHSLCGSNKLLYKRWALSMGNGELRPPTAPKFLDRSFWNSNLRNRSRVPPNMQNMVQIGIRGWAGRTPSFSLLLVLPFVFFSFFLYSSHRVLATPPDRFWRAMAHSTCFPPRKCLLVVSMMKSNV